MTENIRHNVYIISSNGVEAKGLKLGKIFMILKGSMIKRYHADSFEKKVQFKNFKNILITSPYVNNENWNYLFNENVLLDSASIAASIITGNSKSQSFWRETKEQIDIPKKYVTISQERKISEARLDFSKTITDDLYSEFKKNQKSKECHQVGKLYIFEFDDISINFGTDSPIKIGLTKNYEHREKSTYLHSSFMGGDGVFTRFPIYCDLRFMERIVHSRFENRIFQSADHPSAKEFFNVDYREAESVIRNVSIFSASFRSF
jgi:hypothetical protein